MEYVSKSEILKELTDVINNQDMPIIMTEFTAIKKGKLYIIRMVYDTSNNSVEDIWNYLIDKAIKDGFTLIEPVQGKLDLLGYIRKIQKVNPSIDYDYDEYGNLRLYL